MFFCFNWEVIEEMDAFVCTMEMDQKKLVECFKVFKEDYLEIWLGVYVAVDVFYEFVVRVVVAVIEVGVDLNLFYWKDDDSE